MNIVGKLNTAYRVIAPVAAGSPALAVTIYNAATFNSKLLEALKPIQKTDREPYAVFTVHHVCW